MITAHVQPRQRGAELLTVGHTGADYVHDAHLNMVVMPTEAQSPTTQILELMFASSWVLPLQS